MIVKSNWKIIYNANGEYIGDYFNVMDYERIRNNLLELKELVLKMYPACPFQEMVSKSYENYFYAEDINHMENNLEQLVITTYPFEVGSKKVYKANDAFLDYHELNRIEKGMQLLYSQLTGQYHGAKRLAFTCGGGKIAC